MGIHPSGITPDDFFDESFRISSQESVQKLPPGVRYMIFSEVSPVSICFLREYHLESIQECQMRFFQMQTSVCILPKFYLKNSQRGFIWVFSGSSLWDSSRSSTAICSRTSTCDSLKNSTWVSTRHLHLELPQDSWSADWCSCRSVTFDFRGVPLAVQPEVPFQIFFDESFKVSS